MNEQRGNATEQRSQAIERELAELYAGGDTADPAAHEAKLLDEQDALEYEPGQDYFQDG